MRGCEYTGSGPSASLTTAAAHSTRRSPLLDESGIEPRADVGGCDLLETGSATELKAQRWVMSQIVSHRKLTQQSTLYSSLFFDGSSSV